MRNGPFCISDQVSANHGLDSATLSGLGITSGCSALGAGMSNYDRDDSAHRPLDHPLHPLPV